MPATILLTPLSYSISVVGKACLTIEFLSKTYFTPFLRASRVKTRSSMKLSLKLRPYWVNASFLNALQAPQWTGNLSAFIENIRAGKLIQWALEMKFESDVGTA